jgi:cohesin complex subunit SA-1/2
LIFDNEPRVRKAVVNFFAQNVEDAHESLIEDLGGTEAMDEAFGPTNLDDDDFDSPRVEWLKLKCLVEVLVAYDAEDEVEPRDSVRVPGTDTAVIIPTMESRFSLAAENLADRIPELRWEILAGYLLYDHSRTPTQNGVANGINVDTTTLLKQKVRLSEREEILLLEVLNASVKLSLSGVSHSTDKPKKATKAQRIAEQDAQELAGRHLASLIPRLLNKFGALPDAASAILRLVHLLDPETQDAETYSIVLEEVKKQFLTHANPRVLEDALMALLHAMKSDSEDIAHSKIASLVEDAVLRLNHLSQGVELARRGNLDEEQLVALDGVILRLEMIGRIEDIGDAFESTRGQLRRKSNTIGAPIDVLLSIVSRGVPVSGLDPGVESLEDSVTLHAVRAIGFYFMWKIRAFQKQLKATGMAPTSSLQALAGRKKRFVTAITDILVARSAAEEFRLVLAGALVDHYITFASLVHVKLSRSVSRDTDEPKDRDYLGLVSEVPKETQMVLLNVLSAAEKAFARRTKRTLSDPEEDEPATDDEPEDDEEEAEGEGLDAATSAESRLAVVLVAEQRLCELAGKLVLGIWADVLDGRREGKDGAVRKRLNRNRGRLGANFKAVVDALERGAPHGVKSVAKPVPSRQPVQKSVAPVEDRESEDENVEDGEEDNAEAGGEEHADESPEREDMDVDKELDSILGD